MFDLLKDKIIKKSEYLNSKGIYTFLNPYSYYLSRRNKEIFCKFDGIMIDGVGLRVLLKLLRMEVDRISFDMTSIAPGVLRNAVSHEKSIYFVGSTEEVMKGFIEYVKKSYPNLNIVGFRSGFFHSEDERVACLKDIQKSMAQVVIVGMGTPLQEKFLVDLKSCGWDGLGYTCGGFFHQTTRKGGRYYPLFIDRFNLRWLYRIYDEPKLLKRYFFYYPISVVLLFFDFFRSKF